MATIASQITSLTIVYPTVYSDAAQRKHQSSASLAFVPGIHRGPVYSPHKWPVTRKMFPFDDVIMLYRCIIQTLNMLSNAIKFYRFQRDVHGYWQLKSILYLYSIGMWAYSISFMPSIAKKILDWNKMLSTISNNSDIPNALTFWLHIDGNWSNTHIKSYWPSDFLWLWKLRHHQFRRNLSSNRQKSGI